MAVVRRRVLVCKSLPEGLVCWACGTAGLIPCSVVLLANSDIHFTDDVGKLRHVDFANRVLVSGLGPNVV